MAMLINYVFLVVDDEPDAHYSAITLNIKNKFGLLKQFDTKGLIIGDTLFCFFFWSNAVIKVFYCGFNGSNMFHMTR